MKFSTGCFQTGKFIFYIRIMASAQMKWTKLLQQAQPEADWERMAEKYPWFSMGSFMRHIQHPGAANTRHAALHLQNDLLLSWLTSLYNPTSHETAEKPELPLYTSRVKEYDLDSENLEAETPLPNGIEPAENSIHNLATDEELAPTLLPYEKPMTDETMPSLAPLRIPGPGPEVEGGELELQPFHTIDYFAAQGIWTSPLPEADSFDIRVRSFTQWLKSMKRINYQTGQVTEDARVTQMANASLSPAEVVTEAMAEVYAYQGLSEKAIAVYRKLTLRHPEKSAFFAARIEKLQRL
jgi:hypothetical protein